MARSSRAAYTVLALCYALTMGGQSVAAAKSAEQEKVGAICCSLGILTGTREGPSTGTREGDCGRGRPARSFGGGWRCRRRHLRAAVAGVAWPGAPIAGGEGVVLTSTVLLITQKRQTQAALAAASARVQEICAGGRHRLYP